MGAEWAIERGRDAHVQHASAQYEQSAMEATVLRQMLDQNGQHEAACRCARYADAVGQCAMLVKVLRDDDDARRGRQTPTNACKRQRSLNYFPHCACIFDSPVRMPKVKSRCSRLVAK